MNNCSLKNDITISCMHSCYPQHVVVIATDRQRERDAKTKSVAKGALGLRPHVS